MSFFENHSNWPLVALKDIATLKRGYDLPTKNRIEGDVPIYAANGINGSHNEVKIKGPGVITGRSGTIGKVHFTEQDYWPLNTSLYVTDFHGNDPKWVFYMLKAFQLERFVEGAGVPTLNRNLVHDELIPLPPLEEQKRIAAILDKADVIRQKRKQAIELAEEFLRSVFLDMFGDYLGSSDNLVSFGDVTKLDAKMVDPTLDEYANLLHIGPDRIAKRTGEIFPALTAREEGLKSKKFLFSEQYVIYSKIRPYLRKAAIPEFVALCSADMYPIKPVDFKVTREFVWMLLLSDFFDNYVCTLPDRASIPKLNKKELAAFQFSLPSFDEIQKFSFIVKEILKTKNTLQDHQLNSINLFSALSQKAFSGQL
ncbi:restriction endonuclease subunit S [Moritella viscosa]|uniref:Type I restriction modification enzyme protein S n=1 Tax=Moritella viscosa TaxID=80854 RepID=A0A1L0ALW9_9GAMM|nr:restriction endonuclease subunit S [Moritella viscosa]SGZ18591.1 Type I restriction modification enzyme protein S [Moritella viscosa]SHO14494.1 Type I restriction modification enzyme protein S [Moritella viscosa]SHO15344.1 Type I restriction modification enzyme protein S [Moritella viscosa]SHO18048.1 Type I restriction modification enzyme protein S [Moritella viscosa]SHO18966.1 Type I restriction modification enzyme protein S [Moritella viscosa]